LLPDRQWQGFREGDATLQKQLIDQYRVYWDGTLKAGESREVTLAIAEGPYLPLGTLFHAQVTWTDAKGGSGVLNMPNPIIHRTD
jgi:hypothetical protein